MRTFASFGHLATLFRRTNVMQIIALTRSSTVSAASHAARTHTTYIRTYMYVFYFSQPEFFCCCFCCAHSHAYKRSTHIQKHRAASLALPACCAQLLLPSPPSLHTMLCCAVITAFALCYIFSLRVSYILRCTRTRTHMYTYIDTHTQAQTQECVRKSDDWKAASASSTALRLRAHSGFIIFIFFRQFAFVCSLRADAFRCWAPKKSEKPLCEIYKINNNKFQKHSVICEIEKKRLSENLKRSKSCNWAQVNVDKRIQKEKRICTNLENCQDQKTFWNIFVCLCVRAWRRQLQ